MLDADGKIPNDRLSDDLLNKADKESLIIIDSTGDVTQEISPNKYYKFANTAITSLTISLASEVSGIVNEYMFEFIASDTPTTLTLPENISWIGGTAPTIKVGKTYQVSIINNLAVYGEF